MADITTSTVAAIKRNAWDIPDGSEKSEIPRAEILFQGSQVIPIKIGVDQSMWTLQCNFPRNFIYRVVEFRIWATSDQNLGTQLRSDATCLVSTDAVDVDDYYVALNCTGSFYTNQSASQFIFTSVDPHYMMFMESFAGFNAPIDASKAAARLFIRWLDPATDQTEEWKAWFRIRALQYDIDQARTWAMHSPSPVIQS